MGIYKVLKFKKGEKANLFEQTVIEWLAIEKEIGPAFRAGDIWTETVPSDTTALSKIFKKIVEAAGGNHLLVLSKTFGTKKLGL